MRPGRGGRLASLARGVFRSPLACARGSYPGSYPGSYGDGIRVTGLLRGGGESAGGPNGGLCERRAIGYLTYREGCAEIGATDRIRHVVYVRWYLDRGSGGGINHMLWIVMNGILHLEQVLKDQRLGRVDDKFPTVIREILCLKVAQDTMGSGRMETRCRPICRRRGVWRIPSFAGRRMRRDRTTRTACFPDWGRRPCGAWARSVCAGGGGSGGGRRVGARGASGTGEDGRTGGFARSSLAEVLWRGRAVRFADQGADRH